MMCNQAILNKILAVLTAFLIQNSADATSAEDVSTEIENLSVSMISVSCLKVTWDCEEDTEYSVICEPIDENYEYIDNIYVEHKADGLCYITGLRENNGYYVTVEAENADGNITVATVDGKTECVEVIWEFPYEDGWTSCFAGERQSGLTRNPSLSAIQGAECDIVTDTGIMRDEYGDYCCAMGVAYGYCNDRFLIELENGQQFTTKICDSKGFADDGNGNYHWFCGEGNGKCIVEFIYDDYSLPSCVAYSGSWGYYNWCGMDLCSDIKSIKKINYGETVEY